MTPDHRRARTVGRMVILAAALRCVQPTPVMADEYEDQVRRYLMEAYSEHLRSYNLVGGFHIGKLLTKSSDAASIHVTLRTDYGYFIAGVCDNDCHDVDLKLYDENNGLIDSDTLFDDRPAVMAIPRWTGPFRIDVSIANCRAARCTYGVGVFEISASGLRAQADQLATGTLREGAANSPFGWQETCSRMYDLMQNCHHLGVGGLLGRTTCLGLDSGLAQGFRALGGGLPATMIQDLRKLCTLQCQLAAVGGRFESYPEFETTYCLPAALGDPL